MSVYALIVAAGAGSRFGGDIPKQYQLLHGKPLLLHSVHTLLNHPDIAKVAVVIHEDHLQLYHNIIGTLPLLPVIIGGKERQDSVRLGLNALAPASPSYVLIHDAARPFVSDNLISNIITTLPNHPAVIPTLPITDTIKSVTNDQVTTTLNRNHLRLVQTPQGFDFALIHKLHQQTDQSLSITDDAMLVEAADLPVHCVKGDPMNHKMTHLADRKRHDETITAQGFDVHAFGKEVANATIMLGGIAIAHSHEIEAHSDGDVLLHALTDALLGSIAAGDIGMHFPPNDPQWKNKDSSHFVQHANQLLVEQGISISHIDATILGESPKISPYREKIQNKIASLLQLDPHQVSIKATTTEQLGYLGRKEGIAASVIVTVKR